MWTRPGADLASEKPLVDSRLTRFQTDRRQYILNLRGGVRAKKTQFFGQIFQKVPKNAFFGLFLPKFSNKIGTKQA